MRIIILLIFLFLSGCQRPLRYYCASQRKYITVVHASFPGGIDSLAKFIERYHNANILIPDSLNEFNDSFYNENVLFDVDSAGIVGSLGQEIWSGYYYCDADIDTIFKHMPRWEPAYIYNKRTKNKALIPGSGHITIKYYYYNKRPW